MNRKAAFDPARLDDDDLDQLLPPPTTTTTDSAPQIQRPKESRPGANQAPGYGHEAPAERSHATPTRTTVKTESARGKGGRPSQPSAAAEEITEKANLTVAAARIPKPLYDAIVFELLAGIIERPSYAQIVAWTCEDHPDDVLTELQRANATAQRTPRGRRLATEVVPCTLRFRPPERRVLDALVDRGSSVGSDVTRTAGIIAALRVAVKHGLPG